MHNKAYSLGRAVTAKDNSMELMVCWAFNFFLSMAAPSWNNPIRINFSQSKAASFMDKEPVATRGFIQLHSMFLSVCFFVSWLLLFPNLFHELSPQMISHGHITHSIRCVRLSKGNSTRVWQGLELRVRWRCNHVSSSGPSFVMAHGRVEMLFESRKCVRSNWKQFLTQRMTEVYCVPLACLYQVVGETLYCKVKTDYTDCSFPFECPRKR